MNDAENQLAALAGMVERRSKSGLRPCPFCGGINLFLITLKDKEQPITIECGDCGATGPNSRNPESLKTTEELRTLWDVRKTEV
jgi:hypothetical protein